MKRPTTRRLLKCLAVSLIMAQVGCAARGVQVSPTPPAVPVAEADREACAAFAKRESKDVRVKSVSEESARGFAQGLLIGIFTMPIGGPGPILAPVMALTGGVGAARANYSARKSAYGAAEGACLAPVILAGTLGPEHPDVAAALRDLAPRYAGHKDYVTAESLYQRALEIQERAFGPESVEVAATLAGYSELLRATHREEAAADLETRARVIRANAEQNRTIEAAVVNATEAETVDPPVVSVPAPTPVDESE
jgi:hypothetical protein